MPDFWIDVQDSGGNVVGPGPITTASSWRQTARLNRAGSFAFEMPAADPRAALIQAKRTVWCYTLIGGSVTLFGAGIVDAIDLRLSPSGASMLAVSGDDLLRELTDRSVGFLELSDGAGAGTATALADAMAFAPAGWSLDAVNGYSATGDTVYGRFAGESVLQALVKIGQNEGENFRLGSGRQVVWLRSDTPASGLRAIGDADGPALAGNDDVCLITDLSHTQNSYEQISRVYAFGAGNGRARVTLADATASAPAGYTLASDTLGDYLAYDAATSRIERFMSWKEIAPVTNSANDLASAGNALLDTAYEHLSRLATPQQAYSLAVTKLAEIIEPGETVHVIWREITDSYTVADIDANLVVLEATRDIRADGAIHTTALKVSTIDRWPMSDADVIAAQMEEARLMDAHPQIFGGYYPYNFQLMNLDSSDAGSDSDSQVLPFDDRQTRLVSAKIRIKTAVFESTAKGAASGGASTSGSGGGTTPTTSSGGGSPTTSSGGGTTASSTSGGGVTPTTSSGGGTTLSSTDGGGTSPTTTSGGSSTPTTSSGGGTTLSSTDGGGTSPTTTSGGSSTPTTSSGGSSTPTTSSGGSTTPTSSSTGSHRHDISIEARDPANITSSHKPMYLKEGGSDDGQIVVSTTEGSQNFDSSTMAAEGNHSHSVSVPNHTHSVSVPSHSHTVSVPGHTHDVTIFDHNHDVTIIDHSHSVSVPGHTHDVTIFDHNHDVTIGNHSHTVIVPGHTHDVTIGNHSHSVTVPSHDHTVTVPNHTHSTPAHTHDPVYGVFRDTQYPGDLTVTINGVDVTNTLFGTATIGSDAAELDVEAEIADLLNAAAGGFRQDHSVVITAGSGRGRVFVDFLCFVQVQAILLA